MGARPRSDLPLLTLRELNRALLARQLLLERRRVPIVRAVEQLGGLQAQWAPSPYVALWSRIDGFERERLQRPIDKGEIVKTTLMRATLHLVSAREYPAYALATLDGRFGAWRPPGGPERGDLREVYARVMRFAAKTPRTRDEIREHTAAHLPDDAKDERLRNWLLWAAVATSGLIWEPDGAHWDHRKLARFIAPAPALRPPPADDVAYDLIVRRHLGAFGPATVQDIAAWSSVRLPLIRGALDRLKGLLRLSDERGRELYDLADAPRPPADTAAPVRFLARFDAAILGHAAPERTRILPEAFRKRVIFSAEVWPTFLVDGFVAGRWRVSTGRREAIVELLPFRPLARPDRVALEAEGERLARFYVPEATVYGVRV
ncbi:MAG: winged helix DNA-binding domain-containing protein [Chloroflexi bacterium]|nr:MAG: winged helix DNA-binding domain-containing protein [Chloroflexota bacterium]